MTRTQDFAVPTAVSFGLLGPVDVRVGRTPVAIGGRRAQAVLAALLLQANQVVAIDRVVDLAWGDEPPETARVQAQNRISALRRLLRMSGQPDLIETRGAGYRLRVAPGCLDVDRFHTLVQRAATQAQDDDPASAAESLSSALALWRGSALDGLSTPRLRAAAQRLEESRLAAQEQLIDIKIQLGQHDSAVGELTELVTEHPWRERLTALLMTALYRSDRKHEALRRYDRLQRRLAEELGVDPGPDLIRLRDDILRGSAGTVAAGTATAGTATAGTATAGTASAGKDGSGTAPTTAADAGRGRAIPPRPIPRQLPAAITALVGRDDEIERVVAAVTRAGPAKSTPAIAAIHGPGGVGKTALAVAAAHAVSRSFPDGQLFVDLQGATPNLAPLTPADVLGRFLRAVGVAPGEVPPDPAEAAALFRTVLADRRVLIVADNAAAVEQVADLLPATGSCGVIITSRRILGMLDGAIHIGLRPLTPDAATSMLRSTSGRAEAEPDAVADVAGACGYLPLALRVAAARLIARPDWSFAELARRLRDEQRTLDELTAADETLRANLRLSWEGLRAGDSPVDALAANAMLRLGAIRTPSVQTGMVAAVCDTTPRRAQVALDRLVEVRLIEVDAGRYRMHDLVRLLAAELAGREPADVRRRWLLAALQWYRAGAERVGSLMRGSRGARPAAHPAPPPAATPAFRIDLTDAVEAGAWLDAERAHVVALVRQCLPEDPALARGAGELVVALYPTMLMRGHHYEWDVLCRSVLDEAVRLNDPRVVATIWTKLAVLYSIQLRADDALDCVDHALPLLRSVGDRAGEASALESAGMANVRCGRVEQAVPHFDNALLIRKELGNPFAEAITLSNAAEAYLRLGHHEKALTYLHQSLDIRRDCADLAGEAITLLNLGEVHLTLGQLDQAMRYAEEAITRSRIAGERENERRSFTLRARARLRTGAVDAALKDCEAMIALGQESGNPIDPADLARLVTDLEAAGQVQFAERLGRPPS